jgi:hypothetical protein
MMLIKGKRVVMAIKANMAVKKAKVKEEMITMEVMEEALEVQVVLHQTPIPMIMKIKLIRIIQYTIQDIIQTPLHKLAIEPFKVILYQTPIHMIMKMMMRIMAKVWIITDLSPNNIQTPLHMLDLFKIFLLRVFKKIGAIFINQVLLYIMMHQRLPQLNSVMFRLITINRSPEGLLNISGTIPWVVTQPL